MDRKLKPLNETLYKVLGNNNFVDILSKQHHWKMATLDCIYFFYFRNRNEVRAKKSEENGKREK